MSELHLPLKRVFPGIFLLLIFFSSNLQAQSCPAQGTEIFPSLEGQALLDALVAEYKTSSTLGYDVARDTMYSSIDYVDGSLSGLYTGYSITLEAGQDPSTDAYNKNINAEHTWPQSKGAGDEPARSDMHHLHPTLVSANSARSSHPFMDIPDEQTVSWWINDGSVATPVAENIDGYSEESSSHPNASYSGSWEPREQVKGDVARGMFYFYTMYKSAADAADSQFFEVQKAYLRSWNSADPVSAREYERTCAIAPHQGNKVNPFVIDPTLVERAYFGNALSATTVSFAAPLLTIDEDQGSLTIEVEISNPSADTATTVTVSYSGGTATAGDDFTAFNTQTLTFPAGSGERQSVTLSLIDDELEESEETILLQLQNVSGPNGAVLGDADTAEITIRDNDGSAPTTAWINEFHYDNDGTDEGEFVEIAVNAEFADLTNVQLTLYNGSNGSSYATYSGNDFTKGSTENGITFYYANLPSNGLQNGSPDGMSLDLSGEVLQFISYEGSFSAADGIAQGMQSTDIGAEQAGDSPVGSSVSLTGSGRSYDDFSWEYTASGTKGGLNSGQSISLGTSNAWEPEVPGTLQLKQNYPNPFNPATLITYELASSTTVRLSIHDLLGREIAVLVNRELQNTGMHQIAFDAGHLSSGIYLYRLSAGTGEVFTRRMTLLK